MTEPTGQQDSGVGYGLGYGDPRAAEPPPGPVEQTNALVNRLDPRNEHPGAARQLRRLVGQLVDDAVDAQGRIGVLAAQVARQEAADTERQVKVTQRAVEAFWATVAAAYPEVSTGDLDPVQVATFDAEAVRAVTGWVRANRPSSGDHD